MRAGLRAGLRLSLLRSVEIFVKSVVDETFEVNGREVSGGDW